PAAGAPVHGRHSVHPESGRAGRGLGAENSAAWHVRAGMGGTPAMFGRDANTQSGNRGFDAALSARGLLRAVPFAPAWRATFQIQGWGSAGPAGARVGPQYR